MLQGGINNAALFGASEEKPDLPEIKLGKWVVLWHRLIS